LPSPLLASSPPNLLPLESLPSLQKPLSLATMVTSLAVALDLKPNVLIPVNHASSKYALMDTSILKVVPLELCVAVELI
ncbi:hypothetical protein K7432_018137, partial [Basidiobolus ranarum]